MTFPFYYLHANLISEKYGFTSKNTLNFQESSITYTILFRIDPVQHYLKPMFLFPLQLEHENRMFKTLLKTYRGQFTQAHLDRISKGRCQMSKIMQQLDDELKYHAPVSKSRRELDMKDISMLTSLYVPADLLHSIRTTRAHSPTLLNVTENLMSGMNGQSLEQWLKDRIELCKIRQYYRQFYRPKDTTHSTSSLDLVPDSDWSSMADFSIPWSDVEI